MTGSPVAQKDINDQLAPVDGKVNGTGDNPGDPIANAIDKGVQIHSKIAAAAQSSATLGFSAGLNAGHIYKPEMKITSTTQVTKKISNIGG